MQNSGFKTAVNAKQRWRNSGDNGENMVAEYLDTLAHILSEPTRLSLTWNYAVFCISHFVYRIFERRCFALTSVLHTAILKTAIMN
jgi:hypothetical protein